MRCPAMTGTPVSEKRCVQHFGIGGMHRCMSGEHEGHYKHICECGHMWASMSYRDDGTLPWLDLSEAVGAPNQDGPDRARPIEPPKVRVGDAVHWVPLRADVITCCIAAIVTSFYEKAVNVAAFYPNELKYYGGYYDLMKGPGTWHEVH